MPWVFGLVLKWHDNSEFPPPRDASGIYKIPWPVKFQSWIVNFRAEVCEKARNLTLLRGLVTEGKGPNSLTNRKTGECFHRKTAGSYSRRDNNSFQHTHATGRRETLWKEVGDASILFSTETKRTDWREKLKHSKGRPYDKSWNSLVYVRQDEKDRRVIIGIVARVVVTSLETDAFVAFVAFFRHAGGEKKPQREVEKRRYSRSRCYSEGKKSKVVCLKTQIQWIFFYGKLKNWDWTLRRNTPGILRMHLVQN